MIQKGAMMSLLSLKVKKVRIAGKESDRERRRIIKKFTEKGPLILRN